MILFSLDSRQSVKQNICWPSVRDETVTFGMIVVDRFIETKLVMQYTTLKGCTCYKRLTLSSPVKVQVHFQCFLEFHAKPFVNHISVKYKIK